MNTEPHDNIGANVPPTDSVDPTAALILFALVVTGIGLIAGDVALWIWSLAGGGYLLWVLLGGISVWLGNRRRQSPSRRRPSSVADPSAE